MGAVEYSVLKKTTHTEFLKQELQARGIEVPNGKEFKWAVNLKKLKADEKNDLAFKPQTDFNRYQNCIKTKNNVE